MLYDPKEYHGIRRSFLPAPRDVEMTLDSQYKDIIRQRQEVFLLKRMQCIISLTLLVPALTIFDRA